MSDYYVSVLDIYMYVQILPMFDYFEHFQNICLGLYIDYVDTKTHCSLFTNVCRLPLCY